MLKRITRINMVRQVLCWIAANYIRLVYRTSRWRYEGTSHPEALWDQNKPFIVAFWHGRLLMMPYMWRPGVPINVLISHHADGEFLSRIMRYFSIETVRGSSKKGGAAALRKLVRLLARGDCIGVTPDGPRGPRMRASGGVVALARMAGVPIVPVAVATTRCRVLGSWDRFLLALPFGRGTFLWGEPIHVARDARGAALEAARESVESALNDLAGQADRRCGIDPIQPAEPASPASAAPTAPVAPAAQPQHLGLNR